VSQILSPSLQISSGTLPTRLTQQNAQRPHPLATDWVHAFDAVTGKWLVRILLRRPKLDCLSDENSTGWPLEADRGDSPVEAADAGSVDVSYWDKASILRSSAKQRKRSCVGLPGHLYDRRDGMAAVPSEAESQR
jgi:hypothetical protein